jgi:hypothetical protein
MQSSGRQARRRLSKNLGLRHRWLASILLAAGVGVVYFLAARLSLFLLSRPDGVAVFWPAAGVSSGTLIALGRNARWPVAIGIIPATIAANLMSDRAIWAASTFALSNVVEALLTAWVIEHYVGAEFSLDRLRMYFGCWRLRSLALPPPGSSRQRGTSCFTVQPRQSLLLGGTGFALTGSASSRLRH